MACIDKETIREIACVLIEAGHHDKRFHLGETIKYAPTEVEEILTKHYAKKMLKPCPFCGGEAVLDTKMHSVSCGEATCFMEPQSWAFETDEEAIEAWNHRAEVTS